MVRHVFAVSLIFLLSQRIVAQPYASIPWHHQLDGAGASELSDIALDSEENILVSGFFTGTIAVGGLSITGMNIGNGGNGLVYKSTPTGKILWTKCISGSLSNIQVETDQSNNVYIYVGTYQSLYIDGVMFYPFVGGWPEPATSYLIKLDSEGHILWSKPLTSREPNSYAYWEGGFKIKNNSIYAFGRAQGTLSFEGTLLSPNQEITRPFFAKYDLDGNFLLVKNLPSAFVQRVEVDKNGFFYICGLFSPQVEFDTNTIFTSRLTNTSDFFLAKYDATGNFVWARAGIRVNADSYNEDGRGIAIDNDGNVYAMGWIKGTMNFDAQIITGNLRPHYSDRDTFLVKYDQNGNIQFAKVIMLKTLGHAFNMHLASDTLLISGSLRDASSTPFYAMYNLSGDSTKMEYIRAGGFAFDVAKNQRNNILLVGSLAWDVNVLDCVEPGVHQNWQGFLVNTGPCKADEMPKNPIINILCDTLHVESNDAYCVEWYKGGTLMANQHEASLPLHESGNYQVGFRNACGITLSNPVAIDYGTLEKKPEAPNLNFDCEKMNITNSNNTDQIEWLLGDVPITGEHSIQLSINQSGSYHAIFRNNCGETKSNVLNISEDDFRVPPKPVVDRNCFVLTILNSNSSYGINWLKDGVAIPNLDLSITVNQNGLYQAVFKGTCGNTLSDPILMQTPDSNGKIELYNVITPNGDDKNETYQVLEFLKGSSVTVYNRWGSVVYNTKNYQNDWNGDDLSAGVYFCVVKSSCVGDIRGTISIIR